MSESQLNIAELNLEENPPPKQFFWNILPDEIKGQILRTAGRGVREDIRELESLMDLNEERLSAATPATIEYLRTHNPRKLAKYAENEYKQQMLNEVLIKRQRAFNLLGQEHSKIY